MNLDSEVGIGLPYDECLRWDFGNKRTLKPLTQCSSILGISFNEGVMIAADTLGAYGSLARFRNCSRVRKINDTTILGAGGDYADFLSLIDIIEKRVIDEECKDDGFTIKPKSLYCWLTRILYNRRSKFDPYWNTFVIGGISKEAPFLGYVDKLGTAFEAPTIATGYGAFIAQPLLRGEHEKNPHMGQAEAQSLLIQCMNTLWYRDAQAFHKLITRLLKPAAT